MRAFLREAHGREDELARLEETVELSDRTWDLFVVTYELRKAFPTPMDTGDAMNTMVPIAFMLGTQEAYDFYKELHDELELKIL
jgi:benzoyl-CoA reductase/2-hydroxyglutaryl-CoA dehydratase subunit BcrC/BadD/HgdB